MDKKLNYLKEKWKLMEFSEREYLTFKGLTKAQLRVLSEIEPQFILHNHTLSKIYPFNYKEVNLMAKAQLAYPDGALSKRGASALLAYWDKHNLNKEAADYLWHLIRK